MNKRIKILLIAAGAAITLLLAAIVVVLTTVDPNDYKNELAQVVRERTGRELVFDGDIGFTFFPYIGLRVGPATLGNAVGFATSDMVRIERAEVSLRIAPLLSGKLVVGEVVLDGFTLHLARNSQGVGNWEDLATHKADASSQGSTEGPVAKQTAFDLAELSVQGVEITNASLVFEDQQKGTRMAVSELNLKLGRIQGGGSVPFELGFGLALEQPKLEIRPVLSGDVQWNPATSAVAVKKLQCSALGLHASGQLQAVIQGESPSFSGSLQLAKTSLRQLARKLGVELPQMSDPTALEEVAAEMELSGTSDSVDLSRLDLTLDGVGLSIQGNAFDFDDPSITIAAQVGNIDFGRYLPIPNEPKENVPLDTARDEAAQPSRPARPAWETARELLLGMTLDARLAVEDFMFKNADGAAHFHFSSGDGEGDFSGGLTLHTGSVRELARDLGVSLPTTRDADVLGAASLELAFRGTEDSAQLEHLAVRCDDSIFVAEGTINDFTAPSVRFAAQLDCLDVDRYLPPQTASESDVAAAPGAGQASQASSPAREPDLSALRSLDLDASLDVGELKVMDVRTEGIEVGVSAHNGVVNVSPLSLALYGGVFDGQGALDVNDEVASWTGKGVLKGLRPRALLQALLHKDVLRGTTCVDYDLSGAGLTSKSIMGSLCGSASFSIADGAVIGVDVGKMIRDGWNQINGMDLDGEESGDLDFSKISGSVELTNGRVVNKDLALVSPLVEVAGAGSADLSKNTADYAATVTVVGALDGIEGDILSAVQDVPLPVYVRGDLSQPDIGLDIKAMARALVAGVVEEGLSGLADALLGDGDADSYSDEAADEEAAEQEESGDEVIDLFKDLF